MITRGPNGPTIDLRLGDTARRRGGAGRSGLASLRRVFGAVVIVALALASLPGPRPLPRPVGQPAARPTVQAPPHGDERFLIVGLTQDQHRTDSIMVAQWDASRHQARVLGVPRDIGVTIQGIGYTKLVHAYATGGVGRTRAAVVKHLNVPIAHYFVFSLPALRHLVDLIGGVPITVEKRMLYNDREQGLFINLQPGPQVLDGAHAEQYLRFRNDPEGDIGRIRRQQRFLRAALQALHRPQVWIRLPQIIGTARADLGTDLTSEQLLGWAHEVDHLTPDAVSAQTLEGRPAILFDNIMRMRLSFLVSDPDDLRAKVRWLISGETPPAPKP
jgi:LCP family protein required for cell wall assembly